MCVIGRRCQLGYQLSLNPLSCLLIRSSRFHITKRPKPQQLPHRLRTAKASLMSPTYRAVDIERPDAEPVRIAFVDHPSSSSHAPPKATILLIHGFPQTSYQFHHVLPLLAEKGYRCIAPDYRGAGRSSKHHTDSRKTTMAADMVALLDRLAITEPIHVVGHDIGGMVAFALASRHPERVRSVCWGECPLSGTTTYQRDRMDHAV
jgi:alpha-beta hydrolase superfamily lysophospholipase